MLRENCYAGRTVTHVMYVFLLIVSAALADPTAMASVVGDVGTIASSSSSQRNMQS